MSRDDWFKVHTVCFIVCPSLGLLKYIETKLETTCFHLTQNFSKKQKIQGRHHWGD